MKAQTKRTLALIGIVGLLATATITVVVHAQQEKVSSSYGPTNQTMTFEQIKAARLAVKAERAKEHMDLLSSRYVLAANTTSQVTMSGGKPVPVGPTAKLSGVTWDQLDKMTPEQIKEKGLFPFKPLPFADHAEGGMLFPAMTLKLLPRLTRFDLDFDLPEHVLPDAAPSIFLTTRPIWVTWRKGVSSPSTITTRSSTAF